MAEPTPELSTPALSTSDLPTATVEEIEEEKEIEKEKKKIFRFFKLEMMQGRPFMHIGASVIYKVHTVILG